MTSPQVRVSPAHRFGRPHMNGISTEAIADMYWAGEDPEGEYALTRYELLVTLWFEATQGQPRFRRRWREWGQATSQVLWKSDIDVDGVSLPPAREA
jgi:hypothetical protein